MQLKFIKAHIQGKLIKGQRTILISIISIATVDKIHQRTYKRFVVYPILIYIELNETSSNRWLIRRRCVYRYKIISIKSFSRRGHDVLGQVV